MKQKRAQDFEELEEDELLLRPPTCKRQREEHGEDARDKARIAKRIGCSLDKSTNNPEEEVEGRLSTNDIGSRGKSQREVYGKLAGYFDNTEDVYDNYSDPKPEKRGIYTGFEIIGMAVVDEHLLYGAIDQGIPAFLASCRWVQDLPLKEALACGQNLYPSIVLPMTQWVVHHLKSWTEDQYNEFMEENRTDPIPSDMQVLTAATCMYCSAENISYQGSTTIHPLLRNYQHALEKEEQRKQQELAMYNYLHWA
ncbi:hypothetical protein VNI00_018112 [Paramarasmius palmivorus]|uniref:Uncharacterized protein n=1 Tax=Paramarasmius palmivorus TaxID=297713 RepID=A0AAW0B116_9AGAR